MKGIIYNYRRSRHVVDGNQVIVHLDSVSSREDASKLVGKKVSWNTGKRAINGEVRSAHGKQGAVCVRFETGLPGQALGQEVVFK